MLKCSTKSAGALVFFVGGECHTGFAQDMVGPGKIDKNMDFQSLKYAWQKQTSKHLQIKI